MPVTVPQLPSCTTNNQAFIKLGGGVAPSLNYNLPQKTSFTAYGDIQMPINASWFTPAASEVSITDLSLSQIKQLILGIVIYPDQSTPSFLQVLSTTNITTLKQYYAQALLQNTVTNIVDFVANHALDATTYGVTIDYTVVLNNYINHLATMAIDTAKAAISVPNFGNFGSNVIVATRPITPKPALYIIEEYKTSSFLGDYGAGQTINTFSLLPGEKHSITIKSFRSLTETGTRSDNVMDSFSASSAADFERQLGTESQRSNTDVTNSGSKGGGGLSLNLGIFKIGGGGGFSKNTVSTRVANTNSIAKALQKHTDSTNSSRSISVNSSSSQTVTSTDEQQTLREIVNPNLSRVLNFVFRQLLQQYISITYLNDIKVAFSNGNPENFRIVNIEELDILLDEFIDTDNHDAVKQMIWNEYHSIENYKGDKQIFLEESNATDWDGVKPKNYYHKRKIITGNYTYQGADSIKQITVNGPILNVDLNTLRTDSLVVDALLGQGEALDCFNSHTQNAKTQALYIDNDKALQEQARIQQALDILSNISDPIEQAKQFAAIFNPQVQNIIN